jgi:hypothetical protein
MNFGCSRSQKVAAPAAATSFSSELPSAATTIDWLKQATATLVSIIHLEVPVGYQDEAGFHQGSPRLLEPCRKSRRREKRF